MATRPAPNRNPSIALQAAILAATVTVVVVASYPFAAAVVGVCLVFGAVVTAVGRAVGRAAAREATVRVPVADVEITVARASGE